jgi:hypothetical protein
LRKKLEMLDRDIAISGEMIDKLTNIFSPVLTPIEPSNVTIKPVDTSANSLVANRLCTMNLRVSNCCDLLHALINRSQL